LQADPSLDPGGLLTLLESTGTLIDDPSGGAATPRIDVAAALARILGRQVPLLPGPPDAAVAAPPVSAPSAPRLDLSRSRIVFGRTRAAHVSRRTLAVRNAGSGVLSLRLSSSLTAVSVRPQKATIGAGKSVTIVVTFRPGSPGSYRGSLR